MSDDDFDLVAHTKTAARDALNLLKRPDEDILPVVLSNGPRGVSILGAPMPASEEDKDALAEIMTARIALAQATEAAMVCPAYASSVNATTGETEERHEIVMLIHCGPGGQNAWFAKVTRHEDRPPDMSVWEDMGTGCMMGRFASALQEGLDYAKTSYDNPTMCEMIDKGHKEGRIDDMVQLFVAAKNAMRGKSDDNSDGQA